MTFQKFLTCSVLYLEGTTSMSKCSQRRVECLLFDEGEDGRVLDYFDSYTKVNSLMIFQVQVQFKVEVEVEVEVQVQSSGSDSGLGLCSGLGTGKCQVTAKSYPGVCISRCLPYEFQMSTNCFDILCIYYSKYSSFDTFRMFVSYFSFFRPFFLLLQNFDSKWDSNIHNFCLIYFALNISSEMCEHHIQNFAIMVCLSVWMHICPMFVFFFSLKSWPLIIHIWV